MIVLRGSRRRRSVSFTELFERRFDMVEEKRKKEGRPVIGTLCSYAPVELLHSFGAIPVRIWGRSDDIERADALLQPFICPPVRHLMALGLEGRYDFLDGVVHCYTCDATCGLFNIWIRNLEPGFSHLVSLPYLDIDESRAYAMAEFGVLVEKLESATGKEFSAERLSRSMAVYGDTRSLMRQVYLLKARGFPVRYSDIHSMNLCGQVLPVEILVPRLKDYISTVEYGTIGSGRGKRLLLSGSVIDETSLFEFVEDGGAEIVADDTCLGWRVLREEMPEGEPLEALVTYYLTRPPCASRADFPARKRYLLETLEEFDVDAALFVHQKFCDPHLSDHPFLKGILDEAGIPSMQLELDVEGFAGQVTGQVRTRIEGFLEMLEMR
jgi:bcr-type benzoyl-CoA reductase subunit C